MINEPWFTIIMIICILAFIGKCLEIRYHCNKSKRNEIKLLENENYIKYNSDFI